MLRGFIIGNVALAMAGRLPQPASLPQIIRSFYCVSSTCGKIGVSQPPREHPCGPISCPVPTTGAVLSRVTYSGLEDTMGHTRVRGTSADSHTHVGGPEARTATKRDPLILLCVNLLTGMT